MAENKNSFVAYCSWKSIFDMLSDEEAGQLIKHLFAYVTDEDPEIEDRLLKIAFEPIKLQLKRDLKKYEGAKEKQSESGAIGNLKRWNKDLYDQVISNKISLEDAIIIAKNRKESGPDTSRSKKIGSIADNVNDNDTVTGNDNGIENEKEELGDESPPPPSVSSKELKIQKRLEREKEFGKELANYVNEYSKEMVRAFYDYWREPNKSGSQMKWEREDTWSIKLRLEKWSKNDDKWNKQNSKTNENQTDAAASKIEQKLAEKAANHAGV